MQGIREIRSFVLLEDLEGESLEKWLPRELAPTHQETDWGRRRRLMDRLATFVAHFHASGFIHRDLYLSHVFINENQYSNNESLFALIDLQRVFRPSWRQERWRIKDLAALHYATPEDRVGRWERLRFLSRYCNALGSGSRPRPLAVAVDAKADRMRRRRPSPLAGAWNEAGTGEAHQQKAQTLRGGGR